MAMLSYIQQLNIKLEQAVYYYIFNSYKARASYYIGLREPTYKPYYKIVEISEDGQEIWLEKIS